MGIHGPTLRDVAKVAGVSHMAVSLALRGRNGELGISKPVRERIFKAARELGYRPHRIGQCLQSRRTGVLGLVVSNDLRSSGVISNHSVHTFVVGLNHHLMKHQYHIAYLDIRELMMQDDLPNVLQERFLDGLVVHFGLPGGRQDLLQRLDVPVLWWDSGFFDAINCLSRNERAVGRLAAQALLDRGHRRIGFMLVEESRWHRYLSGSQAPHFSYMHRYEGYRSALRDAGIAPLELHGTDPVALGAQIRSATPTALIGAGSELLITLTRAGVCWESSRRRPVSVVAMDIDKRIAKHTLVGGILYDRYACGQQAARMMLQMLEAPRGEVPSETVPPEFREGETVRPVAQPSGRSRRPNR